MASKADNAAAKPATDWEALYPVDETGIEAATADLLRRPELIAHMGWPAVSEVYRQFPLGRGRADILLKHADGSVTLIEVKRPGLSLRDYCTGIGQLAYQAIMAHSYFQARTVRKVLATPGPVPVDVVLGCAGAEIDILPTVTVEQWRAMLTEAEALNPHG